VKLLLDQNLSHRLVESLADLYSQVNHVRSVGLSRAVDGDVWDYARAHGYTIVTKDGDFSGRAFLFGPLPKVVWIQLGNCPTDEVARLLRDRHVDVTAFCADDTAGLLILP